jgi:Protein of unknown function (DUF3689)
LRGDDSLLNGFYHPFVAFEAASSALHDLDLDMHEYLTEAIELDHEVIRPQLKRLDLESNQMEVIIILISILGGNRKADAQSILASSDLVLALSEICGGLNWGYDRYSKRVHGVQCECSTDAALKIHFLGLVSCFGDSDSHVIKQLFFSTAELGLTRSKDSARILDIVTPIRTFTECDCRGKGQVAAMASKTHPTMDRLQVFNTSFDNVSGFSSPVSIDLQHLNGRGIGRQIMDPVSLSNCQRSGIARDCQSLVGEKSTIEMGLASRLVEIIALHPHSKHIMCLSSSLESVIRGCSAHTQLLMVQRGYYWTLCCML